MNFSRLFKLAEAYHTLAALANKSLLESKLESLTEEDRESVLPMLDLCCGKHKYKMLTNLTGDSIDISQEDMDKIIAAYNSGSLEECPICSHYKELSKAVCPSHRAMFRVVDPVGTGEWVAKLKDKGLEGCPYCLSEKFEDEEDELETGSRHSKKPQPSEFRKGYGKPSHSEEMAAETDEQGSLQEIEERESRETGESPYIKQIEREERGFTGGWEAVDIGERKDIFRKIREME